MSTSDRLADLQAQIEGLQKISDLEDAAREAKAAYRENPKDPDLKTAHRAAAHALAGARVDLRENTAYMEVSAGSTTVQPEPPYAKTRGKQVKPGGDAQKEG